MNVLTLDKKSSKLFVLFLAALLAFSWLGAASSFYPENEDACVNKIITQCGFGGDVQLTQPCMKDGFGETLERELDSIANGSVDCNRLDEDKLQNIGEPSDMLKELIGLIIPVIVLLVFSAPLLIPLLPLMLAIRYGRDLSEKFLLFGYWLFNLASIPIIGYVSLLVVEIMIARFSFPTIPLLLLGTFSTILLPSVVAWRVFRLIKVKLEVSDRRIVLGFYGSALIFWIALIAIIVSSSGPLAAF